MQSGSQNIEFALIARVIDTKDFATLDKLKIDSQFFLQQETREVYEYLRQIYHSPNTAGQVPSREMVAMYFPGFYFFPSNDAVSVLSEVLRQERKRIECMKLAQDLQLIAEKNPEEAVEFLKKETLNITAFSQTSEDVSISNVFQQLIQRYNLVQNCSGLIGIPFPWGPLNDATQGMQGSQFIIIYGRPKSMKTWVAMKIATHAYRKAFRKVLVYSREMSVFQLCQRAAALIAEVDYGKFTSGKLQPEIAQHVWMVMQELGQDDVSYAANSGNPQPWLYIVTDRNSGKGAGGVNWLKSKIAEYKPDLVVADGMYLMGDDRTGKRTIDWKQIAHISQDMKLAAQEFNIPIIGVTQANRNSDKSMGEDLTEMSYSDALSQDADLVLRVTKRDRIDEAKIRHTELFLKAPGMREGVFEGIVINGQPATNFDFLRHITAEDMKQTYEEAAGAKKDPTKHKFKTSIAQANFGPPKFTT